MADGRGRVSERVDQVARRAITSAARPEDSVDQLEKVAMEAWFNLVGPDGFLPVLILVFLAMIATPLIGDSALGAAVSILISAAALLLTVYRSTGRRGVRHAILVGVIVACCATAISYLLGGTEALSDSHRLLIILWLHLAVLLLAFPLVLIRAFQHRRITVNTVCATLAAYLLIGLIFTTVYRLFGEMAPPFFAQALGDGEPSPGQYIYFSIVVLTTLGFGDLTPGSDPARAFVMVEAIIGQIFLVTMLARVVSLLGGQRRSLADLQAEVAEVEAERGDHDSAPADGGDRTH